MIDSPTPGPLAGTHPTACPRGPRGTEPHLPTWVVTDLRTHPPIPALTPHSPTGPSRNPLSNTLCVLKSMSGLCFWWDPKHNRWSGECFPPSGLNIKEGLVSGGPEEEEGGGEEGQEEGLPHGRPQRVTSPPPPPPPTSISPLVCPRLGDSVWPGWKGTADKESWERRRGLSWAHKSLGRREVWRSQAWKLIPRAANTWQATPKSGRDSAGLNPSFWVAFLHFTVGVTLSPLQR